MKARLIIVALICGTALLFTSCKGCSSKKEKEVVNNIMTPAGAYKTDAVNVMDSLNLVNNAGEVVTEMYSGKIPGADVPGIVYDLSLIHYSMMDNGVYKLKSTYVDGEGAGKDATFYEYGRFNTFIGIPSDDLARTIRLVPFSGDNQMNFVFETNGVTMLDQSRNRIVSEHNYTLIKKQ